MTIRNFFPGYLSGRQELEYGLTLKTGPSIEPLTTPEAKSHLRLDSDLVADDLLVAQLIQVARSALEDISNRAFVTQQWVMTLDHFPRRRYHAGIAEFFFPPHSPILLPKAPLQKIDSIEYLDESGATVTLDTADYIVSADRFQGRVTPAYGMTWPWARWQAGAVQITFTAGYGDTPDKIPPAIIQAMRMLIGHLYEHRETVIEGGTAVEVPMGVQWLLMPHRLINV